MAPFLFVPYRQDKPLNTPDKIPRAPIYLLGLMYLLGFLSIDLYGPIMPAVGDWFNAPSGDVQLSLSAFMLGLSLGQLSFGPLSDAFGRKGPLIIGLSLYTVISIACLFAESIELMIVLRALQGLCAASGTVIARTVIFDTKSGQDATKDLAIIALIVMISPVLAPIISGLMASLGWQSVVMLMCASGFSCLIWALLGLDETNPMGSPRRNSFRHALAGNLLVLKNRAALGYLFTTALLICAVLIFVTGAPFVFSSIFNMPAEVLGFYFAFVLSGNLIGSAFTARFARRFRPYLLIQAGTLGCLLSGVTMFFGVLITGSLWALVIPGFFYTLFFATTLPNLITLTISLFPQNAGAAAAWFGVFQFLVGSIAGLLLSLIPQTSALPMVSFMLLSAILGYLAWQLAGRKHAKLT